ncbi:MAG: DUF555 domain-containing protein [Halobacteria archaeon]
MDLTVVLEGAWIVEEVDDVDDAISVAISEAGKKLGSDKEYVEIDLGFMNCPACGEPFDSVCVFAGTGLVGLVFEINVYNVDGESHAESIAKKEVGECIPDVPLDVVDIYEKEE